MKDNQNTDKIDMSEINLRYREENEDKDIKPKEPIKKKANLAPFATILVIILMVAIVGLVYVTISNNKSLNKKLNDLSSKFNETEAKETETIETEKPTEETEDNGFEESEKMEGKLTQDLNFRSSPSYDADVLGTIPEGTEVSGYIDGGWLKIEYKGQTGYIGPKYVE